MPIIEPGNIDVHHRPVVHNSDGSISTVRSISVGIDGQEVLIPTVSPDGKILSDDEAIALYKLTGQHLGKFSTPEEATSYAEQLHNQQEQEYMPAATVENSTQPSAVDELRRRGLLATGGNIRALPFASPPALSNANGGTATSNSPGSGGARPTGPTPVVDENNQLIDPVSGAPLDEASANDWWKYLAGAGAIGGGAALASMLRNRGVSSRIPTVEGEIIDPLAPQNDVKGLVDGEYSEVSPTRALAAASTKVGPEEPSVARVVAERKLGKRNTPRANPVPSSDTSVIRAGDALSDLTEEEVVRASEITRELVDARKRGNRARSKQSRFSRRAVLPTGPEDDEGLFNIVVRMMREGKIVPGQLIRAVP